MSQRSGIVFCGKAIEDMNRTELLDVVKQLDWHVARLIEKLARPHEPKEST